MTQSVFSVKFRTISWLPYEESSLISVTAQVWRGMDGPPLEIWRTKFEAKWPQASKLIHWCIPSCRILAKSWQWEKCTWREIKAMICVYQLPHAYSWDNPWLQVEIINKTFGLWQLWMAGALKTGWLIEVEVWAIIGCGTNWKANANGSHLSNRRSLTTGKWSFELNLVITEERSSRWSRWERWIAWVDWAVIIEVIPWEFVLDHGMSDHPRTASTLRSCDNQKALREC